MEWSLEVEGIHKSWVQKLVGQEGRWAGCKGLGRDPPRQDAQGLHQSSETVQLCSLPCTHVIGRLDRMFVLVLICLGHCAQSTCIVPAQEGPALTLGLHLHPCCHHLGCVSVLQKAPHSLHFGYFGVFSLWQAHSSPLCSLLLHLFTQVFTHLLALLQSPSSNHSLHNRSINQKTSCCGEVNSDFIWKVSKQKDRY